MKILVLTNLYPPNVLGGYELGCAQMTQALRQRGHDVRVLTSAQPLPPADGAVPAFRLAGIYGQDFFGSSASAGCGISWT